VLTASGHTTCRLNALGWGSRITHHTVPIVQHYLYLTPRNDNICFRRGGYKSSSKTHSGHIKTKCSTCKWQTLSKSSIWQTIISQHGNHSKSPRTISISRTSNSELVPPISTTSTHLSIPRRETSIETSQTKARVTMTTIGKTTPKTMKVWRRK
jgi:hypothetical protein